MLIFKGKDLILRNESPLYTFKHVCFIHGFFAMCRWGYWFQKVVYWGIHGSPSSWWPQSDWYLLSFLCLLVLQRDGWVDILCVWIKPCQGDTITIDALLYGELFLLFPSHLATATIKLMLILTGILKSSVFHHYRFNYQG